MLPIMRSILAQASILALIALARSQNYDSEYNAEGEAEEKSAYAGEEHQHPDYSKYFSNPQSVAQLQAGGETDNGFVAPLDFSTFFGTPGVAAFGSTNNQEVLKSLTTDKKNEQISEFLSDDFKSGFSEYDADVFGVQDYFEQAQKEPQKAEDDEESPIAPKPGPNYVSYRVPSKKLSSKYKATASDVENIEDELNEKDDEFRPSPPLNLAGFQPSNPSNILDDTLAKLNNPEYLKTFADSQQTPYQKYSFQPTSDTYGLKDASILNAFQGTAAPYNPAYSKVIVAPVTNYDYQPSEAIAQAVHGKDCVKVSKEVSDGAGKFNKQPMNCYVCKDPKSGGKSEHCSYNNEPNPKSYYTTSSNPFGNPEGYRSKREEPAPYEDPYEAIKAKSHTYFSKPSEFEKNYYKMPELSNISEDYNYNPETFYAKEGEEKSYSELQSEELLKKGENCRKSLKDGATCTVCTDAKTGANFEQCSYESAPNEKKYAYVKESKYDGDGNPIVEKESGSTIPQAVKTSKSEENKADKAEESNNRESIYLSKGTSKLIDDEPYEVPKHFVDFTSSQQKAGIRGLDPQLYGSANDKSEKTEETGRQLFTNFDDYHLKLFPQFANQETGRKETVAAAPSNTYFEDLSEKKDVEKVLEEFARKDRSNCKQIQKKGMTCYLCIDKNGIQQEECMYVSESRPQSSHVAYHKVQHLKKPEAKQDKSLGTGEAETSESQESKNLLQNTDSPAPDSEAKASSNVETWIKFVPETSFRVRRDAYERAEGTKLDDQQEPQPQFDVNDEDGLYSTETKPIYSKSLGLYLPKYMLEISDYEKEFDRSVAAQN